MPAASSPARASGSSASARRGSLPSGGATSQAGCLVVAATVSAGARRATGNPRYSPMSELAVEDWPAGI